MRSFKTTLGIVTVLINLWAAVKSDSSDPACDLKLTRPCRTNSTLCVSLDHIRDGYVDCPDGSDEDCDVGSFICKNLQGCVPNTHVRDGSPDCVDESDEECEEWHHECLCGFPRCIDKNKVGDGVVDCVEGSDELAIEKDSYICPPDLLVGQEIFRKKRHIGDHAAPNKPKKNKIITNYFAIRDGITLPTGVLTSTVDSFINKGTTSEYLTHISGQTVGKRYAQVTSYESRTFFALPTKLNVNQVDGLVSSLVKTTVVGKVTHTLVSRVYHTYINGAYAQLVETETLRHSPNTRNYVTILQGEELQGTFVPNPGSDVKTLQFSHLEGSLNPEPVAGKIVTVTGTKGQFIKEGFLTATTFDVFTGTYMKGDKTFVFFIGNSALPSGGISDPSDDTFTGEGMLDGHKVGGVFLEQSHKSKMSEHMNNNGGTKMLTVTIGEPTIKMASSIMPQMKDMKISENLLFDKELEDRIPRARKIPDTMVLDTNNIIPSPIHSVSIPTFVIDDPNQNLGDLLVQEMDIFEAPVTPRRSFPVKREQNIVDDIRKQFNIDTDFVQHDLPTVTYYGFAEFTTTIADTVVVFTPNSKGADVSAPSVTERQKATARVVPTTSNNVFSTATTTVYNTIDLYPSGLVSSIGGTLVRDDMTTLFTTLVYGTYISGQYAQVVRSTSSIYYLVSRSETPQPTATQPLMIKTTASPSIPELFSPITDESTTENAFDSFFNDLSGNTIGRSVSGDSANQIITDDLSKDGGKKVLDSVLEVHPTSTTYTFYSTFVNDGKTTISTSYTTTTAAPEFKIVVLSNDPKTLSTLTYHTTEIISGTTQLSSKLEVLTNKIIPTTTSETNDFFELFTALSHGKVETEESNSEMTTESSVNDSTDSVGLILESSLNSGGDVETRFFPRTYYTTYTYFTTYHSLDTSSVVSSLKTITNVVSNEMALSNHQALTPIVPTYPVTYWTTFTYWTTLVKDNTSITTSAKKTVSSVVHLTGTESGITSIQVTPPSVSTPTKLVEPTKPPMSVGETTYYTTYTMYTTAIKGTSTLVTSVLKTESNVVTKTVPFLEQDNVIQTSTSKSSNNLFDVFGFLSGETTKSTALSRTGLLSTLRGSSIVDGTTTVFSTNVYGSYVDGLYVQIQSTTSHVQDPIVVKPTTESARVATANIGKIIENDVTTLYTSQYVVKLVNGRPVTKIYSTSSYEGNLSNVGIESNPTQIGTVKEVIGSTIKGTKTTFYHTTVIGTVVAGVYAQKVESTSRLVSGPSRTFEIISKGSEPKKATDEIRPTVQLEPSIRSEPTELEILPTSTLKTLNEQVKKKSAGKNRLSFPIRSRKRNDAFAFIRRTSTFQRAGVLTKGFFASPKDDNQAPEDPVETTTSVKATPKPFRFGNDEPRKNLRFRFKSQSDTNEETSTTKKEPTTSERPVPRVTTEQETITENSQTPRPFRFANKKTAGTRASLPFVRNRKQNTSSAPSSGSRFRFETKSTTSTTTTTTTPKPPQRGPSRPRTRVPPRTRPRATLRPKPQTTTQPESVTTSSRRANLFSQLSRPGRKPSPRPRQQTFRAVASERRRPTIPRFRKEESQIDPVYVGVDGSEIETPEYYDILSFDEEDVLSRQRRQADSFGARTVRRGSRRFARNRQSNNPPSEDPEVDPTPIEEPKQFTISNPRFARTRARLRGDRGKPKASESKAEEPEPESSPPKRAGRVKINRNRNQVAPKPRSQSRGQRGKSTSSKPKSRNTLPFRPRRPNRVAQPSSRNTKPKSFRRPSTESRLKVSNRFSPKSETTNTARRRLPPPSSRTRTHGRRPPSKSPTQLLLERPVPPPEPEPGAIVKESDGSLNIVQELTVTREVPVTTTIPLIEDDMTVEKQVITASYTTEVISPNQITQTEIDGQIKLLLSTVESEMKVTQVFIQPFATTLVTYTATFIDGRKTSKAHIIPSTIFSIVTVTTNHVGPSNGVNDILKLFLLQQQQQNPLLAALGLGGQQKPNTYLKTSIYTTTVTNFISTEIPIIFRGKTIKTTVVDSQIEVITTTDITTETVSLGGGGLGPINPLLPLLIQNRQKRSSQPFSVSPSYSISLDKNEVDSPDHYFEDDAEMLQGSIQPDFLIDRSVQIQSHIGTPSLDLVRTFSYKETELPSMASKVEPNTDSKYFLWDSSAELPPLTRNVRSAQRGRNFRIRTPAGRAIGKGNEDHPANAIQADTRPTTYFTTFTYYTTLVDNKGREFIRSSEETITQIKTHGNVQFDDFTKTNPSKVEPIVSTFADEPDYELSPEQEAEIDSLLKEEPVDQPSEDIKKQTTLVGLVRPVTVVPVSQKGLIPDSDRRRIRITVTKKRTVDMSKPADIVDQTTIDNDGRKRVVITRRLPRPQPTAVASPIDPYVGTVNTLYTVYSYLYSMVHGESPGYFSTRLVTASNTIEPSVFTVPAKFRGSPVSSLYTIENGAATQTLDERVNEGITTQIYLASATLAHVRPDSLPRTSISGAVESTVDPTLSFGLKELEKEISRDNVLTATSPPQRRPSSRGRIQSQREDSRNRNAARQQSLRNRQRGAARFTTEAPTTQKPIPVTHRSRRPPSRRFPSRSTTKPKTTTESPTTTSDVTTSATPESTTASETVFSLADFFSKIEPENSDIKSVLPEVEGAVETTSRPASRFHTRAREQGHRLQATTSTSTTTEPTTEVTTDISLDDYIYEDEDYYYYYYDEDEAVDDNATSVDIDPFKGFFPASVKFGNESSSEKVTATTDLTTSAPSTSVSHASEPTTPEIPIIVEESTTYQQEIYKSTGVYETFTTSTLLPILGGEQSITLTLLTSTLRTQAPLVESTIPVSSTTSKTQEEISSILLDTETSSKSIDFIEENAVPTGRAVSFGENTQQLIENSGRGFGAQLSIIGRPDLSTKTMDNGVQVIVADEKPRAPAGGGLRYRPSSRRKTPAITLPPSTLLNQMVLVPSKSVGVQKPSNPFGQDRVYQVNTFYTTFTYYNTMSASDQPLVVSSTEVVSNVVSSPLEIYGNYVENTKYQLETRTYFTTQTFTRTVGTDQDPKTVSSEEIITQVVVTEAPTVSRSSVTPLYSTLVTKTYFTTYTYFSTIINGDQTSIDTNTVISSEVVTESGGIITKPSLPQISKSLIAQIDHSKMPHSIYATKTYFTTSTYLTTILKNGQTVTSSRTEVASNIVTEPIYSSLSEGQLSAIKASYHNRQESGPSAIPYGSIGYIPLGKDVYKELKTLYATYTHFTTLPVGEVISREVTKTNILTSTITTHSVPLSLIISGDSIVDSRPSSSFDEQFPLDPSYIDVNQPTSVSSDILEKPSRSGSLDELKATVLVEKGSDTGTKVVKDSVTTATLVVRPTETTTDENTNLFAGIFDSIFDSRPNVGSDTDGVITAKPTSVLTLDDPELATRIFEDATTVSPIEDSESDLLGVIPVRQDSRPSAGSVADVSDSSASSSANSEASNQENTSSGFGISLAPVLTAMAGIIGNTFVGRLAGQADNAAKRKSGQTLLPQNAIVSANQEPNFIPVGSLAAARDEEKTPIVGVPEHGFIPLHEENDQIFHEQEGQNGGFLKLVPEAPRITPSLESFGPTFRPPLVTEGGFTAMTADFLPTHVSVISGEETIFFDGVDTFNAPVRRPHPHPVRVKVPFPQDLVLSPSENPEFSEAHTHLESSQAPIPGEFVTHTDSFDQFLAGLTSSQSDDTMIEVTTSIGVGSNDPDNNEPIRTIVEGDSTLVSGKTTIYDSLFTKPAGGVGSPEYIDITSLHRGRNGRLTKYITHTEVAPRILTTHTAFQDEDKKLIETIESTLPLRTLVTTIIGFSTEVSTVTPTVQAPVVMTTEATEIIPLVETSTLTEELPQTERTPDYPEGFIPNEANLAYAEENEISRFVESKSPDQNIEIVHQSARCNPPCSANEMCKTSKEEHVCVCRPGFGRRIPTDKCTRTNSYQVDVVIDRLSDNKLKFSPELSNATHPNTQYLAREVATGVDRALSDSEIGGKYQSNTILAFEELREDDEKNILVAKVKIDLIREASNDLRLTSLLPHSIPQDQNSIRYAIQDSLRHHNYSLGGTEIYARQKSTILDASDFDECSSPEHNDCHDDAHCINIVGSFLCKCKDNFKDMSTLDQNPGRECQGYQTCSLCNYHGQCIGEEPEMVCECDEWFSGDRCQINMKVMLIVVVSLGAFLLLLFAICLAFCFLRAKKDTQAPLILRRPTAQSGTMDRRAMIAETSSESSEDLSQLPRSGMHVAVHGAGKKRMGPKSGKEDSGLDNPIPPAPQLFIPRVKDYPAPSRPTKSGMEKPASRAKSQQAALVDILDAGPRGPRREQPITDFKTVVQSTTEQPSRTSRPFYDNSEILVYNGPQSRWSERPRVVGETRSTARSRSGDRLGSTHDIPSELGLSSLRLGGDRSSVVRSEVRSYDETTVRVPIRSLRGESVRSRDFSSQVLSEGVPTNAERDGASTIVYPQMQLYRPVREADSLSDLTAGNQRYNQDFFE